MGLYTNETRITSTVPTVHPSTYHVNVRSMKSFKDAFTMMEMTDEERMSELNDRDYQFMSSHWNGNHGFKDEIIDFQRSIYRLYYSNLNVELNLWNSISYLKSICDNLKVAVNSGISTFSSNDIITNTFNDILSRIKSDPEFGRLAFVTLTRDQLMLNRSIYDGLGQQNREYPYIPASKAVMINQSKNLAVLSNLSDFIKTSDSGRKRIISVGLPAGLLDVLRNQAIDATNDVSYRESNIISIKVWRKNLLNPDEITAPKQFYFDTSKFIIEGRATEEKTTSDFNDAAQSFTEGMSTQDLLNNVVVRTYEPEGSSYSTTGEAYRESSLSNHWKGSQIYNNTVIDFYLKLYMKMTTGIDVSEEMFPFLENEVLFSGPDEGLENIFEELKKEAAEMFPTRDVTSAINYQRLVGELTRSIVLSPKKYRNRIIYPKIFDRVFSMLIDESDFNIISGGEEEEGESFVVYPSDSNPAFDTMGNQMIEDTNPSEQNVIAMKEDNLKNPTYYQFYTTVSLYPDVDDEEPQEIVPYTSYDLPASKIEKDSTIHTLPSENNLKFW